MIPVISMPLVHFRFKGSFERRGRPRQDRILCNTSNRRLAALPHTSQSLTPHCTSLNCVFWSSYEVS